MSRTAILGACAALAVVVAGCGGSSSGGNQSVKTGGANAAAAAKLSSALKSAGTIKVATDASYAPNEFFASDNKTVQGMDVDLGKAIGQELGLTFQFSNVSFDSIIPSLGNRFDLGMSSFTDNKEREKVVDMVDYFSAGTSFMVPKDSSLNPTTVADLCGKKLAVEKGTTQLDGMREHKKKWALTTP